MSLRFMFSNPSDHGSTGGKSVFGKPDKTVGAASRRGESYRFSGSNSKPKIGGGLFGRGPDELALPAPGQRLTPRHNEGQPDELQGHRHPL
ncbi:hypothetical protein [Streptomyces sp. NPDC058861]|uniref:hypothetical protein n=1 Tax=Streptomyces sp. NPDC058861 TaxID=3346653 RepID=UPI0036ABACDA